jgi:hypothetical protein
LIFNIDILKLTWISNPFNNRPCDHLLNFHPLRGFFDETVLRFYLSKQRVCRPGWQALGKTGWPADAPPS